MPDLLREILEELRRQLEELKEQVGRLSDPDVVLGLDSARQEALDALDDDFFDGVTGVPITLTFETGEQGIEWLFEKAVQALDEYDHQSPNAQYIADRLVYCSANDTPQRPWQWTRSQYV